MILKRFFGFLVSLYFRKPWIEGSKNVPDNGSAILASNHIAAIDSLILPMLVPRQIYFMGKKEYFVGRGIKGKLKKAFFESVGVFPVDRSGGNAAQAAIDACAKVLSEKKLLGIYPEGHRSEDGHLYKFHTGVARIAIEAKVDIIPVAMFGTNKAQQIGKSMPKRVRCGVKVGKPISTKEYLDKPITKELLRELTNEVAREVSNLSGQKYIDEYSLKIKH
jgi:1-acyl-sn-glycerol-3-phosphate acyltransferase